MKVYFRNLWEKFSVTARAVRFVFSMDKVYLVLVLVEEMVNALKVFPYLYLTKTAVKMLTAGSALGAYLRSAGLLLGMILLLEVSNTVVNRWKAKEKQKLDFCLKGRMVEKNDSLDYFTLSTKEYFLLRTKAMEGYEQGRIEKNLSLVCKIAANLCLLAGIVVTLSSLGPVLLLPVCVTILVRMLSEYFDRRADYFRSTQISEINRKGNYLHLICENIRFAKEIRVFHLEGRFDSKLREISDQKNRLWKNYMRIFRCSSIAHITADIILQLYIYLILGYLALVRKTIGVDDFVYFFAACQQLQNAMGNLTLSSIDILTNADYLGDFMRYWETGSGNLCEDGRDRLSYLPGDDIVIEFKNVSFRYPNTDFDAVSDINIKLKKGESYLVVGKNGAGKSTFVKLLCRLYLPTAGVITLNGKNIQEYDRDSYLSMLSVLFQDQKLLHVSVADNITSLASMPDRCAMEAAASKAGILGKIRSLPKGGETMYGKLFDENGTEFSGGEAQKVMIARALYKKAPVKIFDEPTAGLDAAAEYSIYMELQGETVDGILVYVTHRLSTGVHSSHILVFSDGKIIETGNHSQLMRAKGVYVSLFETQATLYAGGGET